jgi:zinc protease
MGDLRITSADLDRERPRLLAEVANMFGRFPALGALNVARELIRPTPRGGRKGGLPEQVSAITLGDVESHWRRYYKPSNAILVLAGAVDESTARQAVTANFARLDPGEQAPGPGEPGSSKAGTLSQLTVQTVQPKAESVACLAYAAPQPGSDLYAPFLVLVARFWAESAQPVGTTGRPSFHFPLLEDPAVVAVSVAARPGETSPQAIARVESFVAETLARPIDEGESASARQTFAFFLGTADVPDFALAQNPYGVALALARREQMGIDSLKLGRAFEGLTEKDLHRVSSEVFAPGRHAGAFVAPAH